jgi:hypothetical protein
LQSSTPSRWLNKEKTWKLVGHSFFYFCPSVSNLPSFFGARAIAER